MKFTPIEIIALVFAVIVFIKIIIIFINPLIWHNKVVKKFFIDKNTTSFISLVLAIFVFKYLLTELTIVQIFATGVFFMLILAMFIAQYSKEFRLFAEKAYKDKKMIIKNLISFVIWIVLIGWVFYELFFELFF